MTLTQFLLLAAIGAGGYLLGRRRAPTAPTDSDRAAPGRARPWGAIVAGTLGALLVLGWLAPGPGLFGPEGLFGGKDGLFGPGGLFHSRPGPER